MARNTAAGAAAQIAIKVLSFAFTVLVIRRLGVDTYGQYAAVMAFGAVFVTLADLGLSPYTVRQTARLRSEEDGKTRIVGLFGNVVAMRLMLALVAGSLVVLTGWLTDRPGPMILGLVLGALGLVVYGAEGAMEAVISGYERLDLIARARVFQQLLFVLLGGVVLYLGLGYHSLILANIAGILLLTWTCWRAIVRLQLFPGRPRIAEWQPLLRRALPFGIIGLTLGLSYKFDSVLLNIFHGDRATGTYNAAYTLVFAVVMISNVINTSLYPSLARQAQSSPQSLPAIYERVLRYLLLISLPVAVGGALLAEPIITFLYGTDYANAGIVLSILIWVTPLMFLTEFLGYIIVINGEEKRVAGAIAWSTLVNVSLNALLVPRFGVLAASIMTVLTEVVLLSQYCWLLRARLRLIPWNSVLFRPIVASALMAVVVIALSGLHVLVLVAAGALVYGAALLLLGVFGRDEIRMLRALRRPLEHA